MEMFELSSVVRHFFFKCLQEVLDSCKRTAFVCTRRWQRQRPVERVVKEVWLLPFLSIPQTLESSELVYLFYLAALMCIYT